VTKKQEWKISRLWFDMYWPGAKFISVRGLLERDGRELRANMTLEEATELRDRLSDAIAMYKAA
jgi:hypothetical protein